MNPKPIARAVHPNCNRFRRWLSPATIGLLLSLGACTSKRKAPECQQLVSTLNALSATLAGAHTVLSAEDVQPTQVVQTLKPCSEAAKKAATALKSHVPTVSALRTISEHATTASVAIASETAQLAEYAGQMIDVDAANRAVDENKQRVDKLEGEIKQACDAEPSKCTEVSGVLARFPAPAEQAEVDQDVAVWTQKLSVWAAELEKVQIQDSALRSQVETFRQTWLALGTAMSRLVAILDVGKKYEALNRELNTQIERANQAIAEANKSCEK